jgi:hypothetical protein
MVPVGKAFGATTGKKIRLVCIEMVHGAAGSAAYGIKKNLWAPAGVGRDFDLSGTSLKSLEPFRDHLLVVSGLNIPPAGGHGASAGFLTCAVGGERRTAELNAAKSADQIAAEVLGRDTQLASLEVAIDGTEGKSVPYFYLMSWRTPTAPLTPENNPRAVFEQLFGEVATTDTAVLRARRRRDASILDSVTAKVADLERGVAATDRVKIREYLDSVRDIERRIQIAEERNGKELPTLDQPTGIPPTFEEHARLMYDLQLLAFQTDITRVATFMIGRETTGRTYPELGAFEPHHPLSHHGRDQTKIATLAKINSLHTMLFAEYLQKLRDTPDGDGSLLDHSMILYGSGMSDSNTHDNNNVPLLVVGNGGGRLKGGRHLKYNGEPNGNLLVSLLHKLDVPVESIGKSTGALDIETLSGV